MIKYSQISLCLLLASWNSLWGLNPIHESSYSLLPREKSPGPFQFSVGSYFVENNNGSFSLPMSLGFSGSSRLELGVGLKTRWVKESDNVRHLVLGAKYQTGGGVDIQADLMIATSSSAGNGLSLAFHRRFGHSRVFYSRLAGRIGFLEELVEGEALTAFELAYYPTLRLFRPLSLEAGFIGSSQSEHFEQHLSMDFQPALIVDIGRSSWVVAAATLGLAGERKENLRFKAVVIRTF